MQTLTKPLMNDQKAVHGRNEHTRSNQKHEKSSMGCFRELLFLSEFLFSFWFYVFLKITANNKNECENSLAIIW